MDIREIKNFMVKLNEDASLQYQLDELSKETLLNYVKAANHAGHAYKAMQNQASNNVTYLNTGKRSKDKDFYRDQSIKDLAKYSRHAYNKQMGIDTAIKKIMAKENVEGLDELSRELLARYVKKAENEIPSLSNKYQNNKESWYSYANRRDSTYSDLRAINYDNLAQSHRQKAEKYIKKLYNREDGIELAKDKRKVRIGSSVKENFEFKDLVSLTESYRSIFK